ncbi:MAG: hypothetical protein ACR2RV_09840 [Verrucomicrobiales bacterium]
MRLVIHLAAIGCALLGTLRAEVARVAITTPEPKVWTGQKLPLMVELRSRGSFSGSASFSLPKIPRTVMMKLESVVVSSKTLEGESWFIQTHEFALFSQQSGPLQIPEFPVRFGSREGFTDPVQEIDTMVPAITVEIERPPGSEDIGFLITTESLEVSETWDPQPGTTTAELGSIFKRSITQRADQMTGMALIPAPLDATDGIRVYPPKAETSDSTERGDFSGERRETITYLVEKPGTLTFPEIRYTWWNPEKEELESKLLPAVTVEVAAPPSPPAASDQRADWRWWLSLAVIAGLLAWKRAWLVGRIERQWRKWHPPERVARKALLKACRGNDARSASRAWFRWLAARPEDFIVSGELGEQITDLERSLYGPDPGGGWRGGALADAFRANLKAHQLTRGQDRHAMLPELN